MSRNPRPVNIPENPISEAAIARIDADATALAHLTAAQREETRALARQLNYSGSTDPDVLENSARDAIRRIGATTFELGGYLLLLKSACDHGKFLPALERLNITPRAAQQFMTVTRRFANTKSISYLEGAGVAKLLELLVLDDEQIDDLTGLGETGELKLDDVARMSVKELRQAVRKERSEGARQRDVNAEMYQELMALKVRGKVVAITDWPDALQPLCEQIAAAGRKLATAVSELETCRITLFECAAELDANARPALEAAMGHVGEIYEAALSRAERALDRERRTFDKTLGDMVDADDAR